MDGVIIDSEPLWREAQIKVLAEQNISITIEDCIKHTMGKRIDDVAQKWCDLFGLKINPKILENKIIESVVRLIHAKGSAKLGLYELLDFLKQNNYTIALATSSSMPIINAVFEKLSIAPYFEVINSADDEAYGKPHPAVYLRVIQKLQAAVADCIVLEDSVTGMIAAKAASMKTFVIPENPDDPRFTLADAVFPSMMALLYHLQKQH
ncbi:2-deoxyglucose-6-phosphatase [Flavobacterium sp. UMI-01]|nr:2-deoxyglucose-6-phosphatase [Flavobacterium sp. UMI-01]